MSCKLGAGRGCGAGGQGNVVQFPMRRAQDVAVLDYVERRLKFERRVKAGVIEGADMVEGHIALTAELFELARRFNL